MLRMRREFLENYWQSLAREEKEQLKSDSNFPLRDWLNGEMEILIGDRHLFKYIRFNLHDVIEPLFDNPTAYLMGVSTAHFTFRVTHGFPFEFMTHKRVVKRYNREMEKTREAVLVDPQIALFDGYVEEVRKSLPGLGHLIDKLKLESPEVENDNAALFIWGSVDTAIPLTRTFNSLTEKPD